MGVTELVFELYELSTKINGFVARHIVTTVVHMRRWGSLTMSSPEPTLQNKGNVGSGDEPFP